MTPEVKETVCTKIAEILLECLSLIETPSELPGAVKLYSISDLAERFGKSTSTIRQWMAKGDFGEIVHAGSSSMITEEGLQKYITDHSGPMKKRINKTLSRKVMTSHGPAERI